MVDKVCQSKSKIPMKHRGLITHHSSTGDSATPKSRTMTRWKSFIKE